MAEGEKFYRVAIVGFGFIGRVHAYGYRTLPFYCDPPPLRAQITHVITGRPETAQRAAALLGAAASGCDYRLATENPEVDIVHICTPNHLHAEAVLSAMRHGKHLYCDKPLAADAREADRIAAALPHYRGVAQMTFHNRFFPAVQEAKRLMDESALGRLLEFRIRYLHGGNADPDAPLRWKMTAAAGGGVIADLAAHALDLIEHLAGRIAALTAQTHVAYADRPAAEDPTRRVPVDAEDSVMMLARLGGGAVGTIEATKLATGTEDDLQFELYGSHGALRFCLMAPHYLEWFDGRPGRPRRGGGGWTRLACGHRYVPPDTTFPSPKAAIGWLRGHVASLAHFLRGVARGQPVEPGLAQGVRVQHLIECVRRSAAERQWVDCAAGG